MNVPLATLLLSAALSSGTREATVYTNYREAWRAAQSQQLPLLVILNPGADESTPAVDLELLRRTQQRRDLLTNYVVAVIDTSTPAGERVLRQFGQPAVPRVSVIDRTQKLQIYRAAAPQTAEDWNLVLTKYRAGVYVPPPRPVVLQSAATCFT